MNKMILLLAAMAVLLAMPTAQGVTIQLQDADTENLDDASVYEEQPWANFGAADTIIWRDYQLAPWFFYRGYYKFNLGSIPTTNIINATFVFNVSTNGNSGNPLYIYHVYDGTWQEATLNWNNQPCGTVRTTVGGNCSVTAEDSINTDALAWFTLNITDMVRSELSLGNDSISFLVADGNNPGVGSTHDASPSKEHTSIKDRPYVNITFDPVQSGLELNATPGWTTNQNNILVSCTYNTSLPISVTLTRDGITVPNPYSATIENGQYAFNCVLNVTLGYSPSSAGNNLTLSSKTFECTNTSTYAFSRNMTGLVGDNVTLNLTAAVANNHVKTDLSDVYSARDSWVNFTGGYYFTVNITGLSDTTVFFGNWLANNQHTETPNSENVSNITTYAQANSYYIFTVLDEMNNTEQLPPSSNVTMTLYCDSGQSIFAVNETRILIPSHNDQLNAFRSTVDYPGDYYTRDYLVDDPVESRTIYDADAYEFSILQIPIYVNDYNFYSTEIEIYRTINGEPVVITEGLFDNEHKFVAYLIRDEPYSIRLVSGSTIREAGFFKPVTAGSLTLNVNTITIEPSIVYVSDVIIVNAVNTSETNVQITYNDSSSGTQSVRILVYNRTTQTPFFDTSYPAVQTLLVNIPGLNMTEDYYSVKFEITHDTFGNSPVDVTLAVGAPFLFGIGTTASWIYGVMGFIMMLILGLVITPKDRFVGIVMILMGLAVLMTLTWMVLDPGILALIVVFASISIVYEIKRGGFT